MKIFGVEPWIIISAFLADIIIGDPKLHPVKGIGKIIEITEKFLRTPSLEIFSEKFRGVLLFFIVTAITFTFSVILVWCLKRLSSFSTVFSLCAQIILIFLSGLFIAFKGLIDEGSKIDKLLKKGELNNARNALKALVGRDTNNLSEEKIKIAVVESLSENLCDAIIAPLFYFFIGGFPFLVLYKTVNTLDSMVGYKNKKYINFGWFSAKMDDVFNFIPARISGILIVLSSLILFGFSRAKNSFKIMLRDGRKHPSPNSGIPESAMAGALGIQLGGPNYYGGILIHKPYIGENLFEIKEPINECKKIIGLSSFIFVLIIATLRVFL